MLNIPDKDAMERGGWATNAVMKQVYQHAMDESRRSANEKINTYFDGKIANATQK